MRLVQSYIKALSPESLQWCIEIMNGIQTGSKVGANPNLKPGSISSSKGVSVSVARDYSSLKSHKCFTTLNVNQKRY